MGDFDQYKLDDIVAMTAADRPAGMRAEAAAWRRMSALLGGVAQRMRGHNATLGAAWSGVGATGFLDAVGQIATPVADAAVEAGGNATAWNAMATTAEQTQQKINGLHLARLPGPRVGGNAKVPTEGDADRQARQIMEAASTEYSGHRPALHEPPPYRGPLAAPNPGDFDFVPVGTGDGDAGGAGQPPEDPVRGGGTGRGPGPGPEPEPPPPVEPTPIEPVPPTPPGIPEPPEPPYRGPGLIIGPTPTPTPTPTPPPAPPPGPPAPTPYPPIIGPVPSPPGTPPVRPTLPPARPPGGSRPGEPGPIRAPRATPPVIGERGATGSAPRSGGAGEPGGAASGRSVGRAVIGDRAGSARSGSARPTDRRPSARRGVVGPVEDAPAGDRPAVTVRSPGGGRRGGAGRTGGAPAGAPSEQEIWLVDDTAPDVVEAVAVDPPRAGPHLGAAG